MCSYSFIKRQIYSYEFFKVHKFIPSKSQYPFHTLWIFMEVEFRRNIWKRCLCLPSLFGCPAAPEGSPSKHLELLLDQFHLWFAHSWGEKFDEMVNGNGSSQVIQCEMQVFGVHWFLLKKPKYLLGLSQQSRLKWISRRKDFTDYMIQDLFIYSFV